MKTPNAAVAKSFCLVGKPLQWLPRIARWVPCQLPAQGHRPIVFTTEGSCLARCFNFNCGIRAEGRFAHPDVDNIPSQLRARLGKFDDELFADFTVCPFENDKPGVMRLICVEAATNIVVRQRRER